VSTRYEPYRPQFHFSPKQGWINDPNGLIWWGGKYHLFYQHYPDAPLHGPMHWGHAVSDDLFHWQDLPIALAPDAPAAPGDRSGIFSGSAVDDDGGLTLIYTQFTDTNARPGYPPETQAIATSRDGVTFVKAEENPVIGTRPEEATSGFRDPKVWKGDDGLWRMVLGSGDEQGGKVLLYCSPDLRNWEYLGVLYRGDRTLGTMWECPDLFPIGDKWALIVSVNVDGKQGVVWFAGRFENERFEPETQGWCDFGPDFYAAQTFQDGAGRRILIAWMSRWGAKIPTAADGWAGAMTLPRELYLDENGRLASRPVEEVRTLRASEKPALELTGIVPKEGSPQGSGPEEVLLELSPDVLGDLLEIEVEVEAPGDRGPGSAFGFKLFRSSDGVQEVEVGLEAAPGSSMDKGALRLYVDRERGTVGDGGRFECEMASATAQLRLFVDRSSVEVFTADGSVMTANVFPRQPGNRGVALFAKGEPFVVRSLRIWRLKSPLAKG
jgi:Beta-fructosidases (levanase/invertase)